MKKPLSIQRPTDRTIGQWVATVQLRGKTYTLPVLHLHNFEGVTYKDEMKSLKGDGSDTRGVRYGEHMAALTNPENEGLAIIQRTKTDENGTRSNAGYTGVFETNNFKLSGNGYSLARGSQVAMFAK